MKLIRHILSHILLIAVLFGLVAIYYYRYQVLPNSYAQKIDTYAEKIYPELKKFVSKEPQETGVKQATTKLTKTNISEKPEKQSVESEVVEILPGEIVVEDKLTMPDKTVIVEQIEKELPQSHKEQQAVNTPEIVKASPNIPSDIPMAEEEKTPQPIISKPAVKEDVKRNIPPVISNAEDQITVAGNKQVTDRETASATDLLRSARSAFHKGKLDVSIQKYTELINLENDEADFYGELGNVYYAMGKWPKAGIAYYEAATRLIEEKKFAQVAYLQRVIQGLDVERAKKLAEQLTVLNSSTLNRRK